MERSIWGIPTICYRKKVLFIHSAKEHRSDAPNNRHTTDLGAAYHVADTARFYELELAKREEVYLLLPYNILNEAVL